MQAPLAAYLPPAAVRRIEVTDTVEPLELMRLLYDPWRDDRALRDTMAQPARARGLAFDQLRKNYPVRREFASLTICGHAGEARARELAALGFSVELA
ncbi:DUF3410 domain-containing protein [Marinobacterium aestuariivivens]|uniref:DUF3410 domain-containing protein n=1 Tax=Marinobacterium aestuariivivens TaxID=1698799 RepID=A0ABW1ZT01_9GAMM